MSGKRAEPLITGQVYHAFNRTIGRQRVFGHKRSAQRLIDLLRYYRFLHKRKFSLFRDLSFEDQETYVKKTYEGKPLVIIYAFAVMPDHFHLLLEQVQDGGITKFLSNVQNGLAKYFNLRYEHVGGLFQRPFRSRHIDDNQEFLHVSRYIHLNPVTSNLIDFDDLDSYALTSFHHYCLKTEAEDTFVDTERTLTIAGSRIGYIDFVRNQVDYQRRLHKIRGLLLD